LQLFCHCPGRVIVVSTALYALPSVYPQAIEYPGGLSTACYMSP
jgi:hypothetical protein